MGSNFPPQGNQVVPNNSPSVQMMPSPQPSGQPVNNPNMPIQVIQFYDFHVNYASLKWG